MIYGTVGGPFTVRLDVMDRNGNSASCSTNVTVADGGGGNTPPVANNDSYSTALDTTLNIAAPGVLVNDTDANNDTLTAVLASGVSSGNLTLNPDGSFAYTPNSGFAGQDSFTYLADDGTEPSAASAMVTITVEDITAPVGEALFTTKCIMCHGEYGAGGYAHRSIRGVRASRIRNAMNKWPEMSFLTYLSDTDLADIETYLNNVPRGDKLPRNGDVANGEAQFRQSCSYCHSFGGTPIEPPRPGPDLMGVSTALSDTWLGAWIDFPAEMIAAGAVPPDDLAGFRYVMPDLRHSAVDVWDMVDFLVTQEGTGPIVDSEPVALTAEEFEASRQDYFNLCAGCHGLYRTGATGPNIGSARSQDIGTDGLRSIMHYGTPAGMGNFGQSGILLDR